MVNRNDKRYATRSTFIIAKKDGSKTNIREIYDLLSKLGLSTCTVGADTEDGSVTYLVTCVGPEAMQRCLHVINQDNCEFTVCKHGHEESAWIKIRGICHEYPVALMAQYLSKYFVNPEVVNETLPGTNFLTGVRKVTYESLRSGVNLGRRIFVGRNISAAVIDSSHLQLSEMKAFCFNCQTTGHLAYTCSADPKCRRCKEIGHNTWNCQDTAVQAVFEQAAIDQQSMEVAPTNGPSTKNTPEDEKRPLSAEDTPPILDAKKKKEETNASSPEADDFQPARNHNSRTRRSSHPSKTNVKHHGRSKPSNLPKATKSTDDAQKARFLVEEVNLSEESDMDRVSISSTDSNFLPLNQEHLKVTEDHRSGGRKQTASVAADNEAERRRSRSPISNSNTNNNNSSVPTHSTRSLVAQFEKRDHNKK